MHDRPGTPGECLPKVGGDGNQIAGAVIDGDTEQVFAISKTLDELLQFSSFIMAGIPGTLGISYEALGEQLSAMFEVAAKSAFFTQYLVVGEPNGYEGDADDQRNNQANAQQSHGHSLDV